MTITETQRRLHAEHMERRARNYAPKSDALLRRLTREHQEQRPPLPIKRTMPRKMRVVTIIEHVAAEFDVTAELLRDRRRGKRFGLPRHVCYALLSETLDASSNDVGRWVGGRDHSTILYGLGNVAAKRASDPEFAARLVSLRQRIDAAIASYTMGVDYVA